MSTIARPVAHGPSSAAVPSGDRRFGGAFWVSVGLHGAAVVLALLMAMTLREKAEPPPQIFELVAGPGDNYAATDATQGVETPVPQMSMPRIRSAPDWTPPPPTPVQEVAPTPVAPVAPTPVQPVAPKPKPVAKVTPPTPTRQAEQPRATFDQFQKEHGVRSTPAPRATPAPKPAPRIDANAATRGLLDATSSSAGSGGTAARADAGPALDRYFAMLRERLRANHEKPGGLSDLLSAEVSFTVAANGKLTGVRIKRSSGNADFDRSVLDAFVRVGSIGPRPDGKPGTHELTFRMKET